MNKHTITMLSDADGGGATISSKHDVVELSADDVAAIRGPGLDVAKLLEWLGERASTQMTDMESAAYHSVAQHVRGMASEPAPRVKSDVHPLFMTRQTSTGWNTSTRPIVSYGHMTQEDAAAHSWKLADFYIPQSSPGANRGEDEPAPRVSEPIPEGWNVCLLPGGEYGIADHGPSMCWIDDDGLNIEHNEDKEGAQWVPLDVVRHVLSKSSPGTCRGEGSGTSEPPEDPPNELLRAFCDQGEQTLRACDILCKGAGITYGCIDRMAEDAVAALHTAEAAAMSRAAAEASCHPYDARTSSPGANRGEGSTHVGPGCQPNPPDSLLGVEESGGVFESTEGEPADPIDGASCLSGGSMTWRAATPEGMSGLLHDVIEEVEAISYSHASVPVFSDERRVCNAYQVRSLVRGLVAQASESGGVMDADPPTSLFEFACRGGRLDKPLPGGHTDALDAITEGAFSSEQIDAEPEPEDRSELPPGYRVRMLSTGLLPWEVHMFFVGRWCAINAHFGTEARAVAACWAHRGSVLTGAQLERLRAMPSGHVEPELSHCGECDKQTRFGTQQTCRECESMRLVDAPPEWLVELEKLAPERGHIGPWVLSVVRARWRPHFDENHRAFDVVAGGAARLQEKYDEGRDAGFREMSEFLKSATHEEGAAQPDDVCPAAIDFQGANVACRLEPGHGIPHVGPSKTHGDLSWVDDALDKLIREGQVR